MSDKKSIRVLFFRILFAAFAAAVVIMTLGCSKKNDVLKFDDSDPMATKPGIEWGLVISPYASCHKEAGYDSLVSEHLRRGQIRMIEGKQSVKSDGVVEEWYSLKEGWVTGSDVQVFSNKLKAEKALQNLSQN